MQPTDVRDIGVLQGGKDEKRAGKEDACHCDEKEDET